MRVNQRKKTIDKLLAFEIADLSKSNLATEVVVAVGVTARAFQGTFAGNLDRKGRTITAKDSPPCGDNAFHHQTIAKELGDCVPPAQRRGSNPSRN